MTDVYNVAKDRYAPVSGVSGLPARSAVVIDTFKNDSGNDLTNPAAGNLPTYPSKLYVGGMGNISVIMVEDLSNNGQGTPVLFMAVQGQLAIQIRRLCTTGTTATGVVALWD